MTWEFEHWHDGKVYLHEDNWAKFKKNVELTGLNCPHDWDHFRIFCRIHTPRNSIYELDVPGDDCLKHKIESQEEWRVVHEPFPAFLRTSSDPEAWLPSWHIWADNPDNRDGEKLTILKTGSINITSLGIILGKIERNYFVNFRNKIWLIDNYYYYGKGACSPQIIPIKKPNKRKQIYRSLFDDEFDD